MFEGIVEFVAVAETQGFSSASRKLGVSTSHVSRKVAELESSVGTALVARTTRSVKLTVAGQTYYEQCRELINGLEQANEQVSGQQVALTGILRVSAAGEFAEVHVVPALIEFAQAHPELKLEIDFNSRNVNFIEEGIDFAIRYGRLSDSGLIARKLVERELQAAASTEYLKEKGIPNHPNELVRHDCLVAASELWRFEHEKQKIEVKVNGRWRSNSGRSIVQACEAGLGIAYLPKSSYGDALINGKLVPVLNSFCASGVASWIVFANRHYLPTKARLAISHLVEYFKAWTE